ncbi:MAG: hypothetical protein IJW59_05500 [Clostridia bacterium]|nr:hypothetical protein [Clostridia bacterium]
MNKEIPTLIELIEQASEANKLLISNAIAMECGDLAKAQKYIKEASSLIDTMIKDVFIEVKEVVSVDIDDLEDYDMSILDISKLLAKITSNASSLIECYINEFSESVRVNTEKKLVKCINATKELALSLLLN